MEADEDGVYTPPEDATGGPYESLEEAGTACPYTICDPAFELPSGGLVVSIVDQEYTGEADPPPAPPWDENSYYLGDYTLGDDSVTVHSGRQRFNGFDGVVDIIVGFSCSTEDGCGGVLVQLVWSGTNAVGNNGNPTEGPVVNSSNGWVIQYGGVTGVSWYKCFASADDIVFPLDVGTVTYSIYVASFPAFVSGPYTARVVIDVA